LSGKRAVVALILALVAFGYMFTLNPGVVDFQIYPGARVKTSLALALFVFFLSGVAVAALATAFKEAGRSFFFWRHRKGVERQEEAKRLLARGRGHAVLGQTKTARKLLQRAHRKASGESLVTLEMARVDLADGRLEGAERRTKAVLDQDPRNPEALSVLLDLYRRQGDFEGQVATLRQWLEANPNHLFAHRSLRDLYREAGQWREAARVQERVLELSDVRAVRATELRTLSELRFREAAGFPPEPCRALLERIIRDDPGFAPAHGALGDSLLASGDRDRAVRTWIQGYYAAGQSGLLLRAEEVRLADGRSAEMLKIYRKLERQGGIPPFLRARLLLKLGRNDEALELLEGSKSEASPALGRLILAEALYRVRSYDESARVFRESAFGSEGIRLFFRCRHCGARSFGWSGECESCQTLDSLSLDTDRSS
jgi:tetratricopeptide (TPR) repeat protein